MTNHHLTDHKRIDRMLEMMYQAPTKSGNSCNVQTHNGKYANPKTESVLVSLATGYDWHNLFSCICRSIRHHLKWRPMLRQMLEKHVALNIACVHSQRHIKTIQSLYWPKWQYVYVTMLRKFPPFVGPNFIRQTGYPYINWRIDNPFVWPAEMKLGPTKGVT